MLAQTVWFLTRSEDRVRVFDRALEALSGVNGFTFNNPPESRASPNYVLYSGI